MQTSEQREAGSQIWNDGSGGPSPRLQEGISSSLHVHLLLGPALASGYKFGSPLNKSQIFRPIPSILW